MKTKYLEQHQWGELIKKTKIFIGKILLLSLTLAIFVVLGSCRFYSVPVDKELPFGDNEVPAEVENFSGFGGSTYITLTWTNPPDVDFDYVKIYYGIETANLEYTVTNKKTNIDIKLLESNTTYTITIKTVYANGKKSNGTTISVTTTFPEYIPPAEVENFSGFGGSTYLTFSWTNPPDVDFDCVKIYYGIEEANLEYTGLIDSTKTTINNLSNDTEYKILIKSVDKNGNISNGSEFSLKTERGGAFKIVNSWGVGGWENKDDGHYWITYDAFLALKPTVFFYENNFTTPYQPRMLAVFEVEHPHRDEAIIEIIVDNDDNHEEYVAVKRFQSVWGSTDVGAVFSGNQAFKDKNNNQITIAMDISELIPYIYNTSAENNVYLHIHNRGKESGKVKSFKIEYYTDYTAAPFKTITGETGEFNTSDTYFEATTANALTDTQKEQISPLLRASILNKPVFKMSNLTKKEVANAIQKYGVYEENKNYNFVTDSGFGTGLAPLTEEEWHLIKKVEAVELPQNFAATAESVDLSATNFFPPIANQGNKGACVGFSVGYYIHTYTEAKEHNWDLSDAKWVNGSPDTHQDKIMSPDFFYNQINSGKDEGSSYKVGIDLAVRIGGASWEKMPYNVEDYSSWPNEATYRQAAGRRGRTIEDFKTSEDVTLSSYSAAGYVQIDSIGSLNLIKNILSAGYCLSIAVDAGKKNAFDNIFYFLDENDVISDFTGIDVEPNHANTIVGYKEKDSWDANNPDG